MDGSLDVHMAQGPGRFQKLLLGNGGPGLYRAPGKGRAVEADRSREHADGVQHLVFAVLLPAGQALPVTRQPFSSSTRRRQPLGQTIQINSFMLPPPPR